MFISRKYTMCFGKIRFGLLSIALLLPLFADAQTCQFIGNRTLRKIWLENGLGLVLVPTANYDNAAGCADTTQAIVPVTHPLYKNIQAAAMMAMATGTPINAYGCGCQSAWNTNYPVIINFGVGVF